MEFASGGLSNEQHSDDGLVQGGIVNARTWRILDAGPNDGCYIPQNTKRHSVELLLKTAKAVFGGENGDK